MSCPCLYLKKSRRYTFCQRTELRDSLELAKKGLLNIYSNFSDVYVTNVTIPLPVPKRAEENQYLTYDFRNDLADAKRMLGADYLILVTDVDIYAGDRWAYVFGEALVNDGVAIVSYHRLSRDTGNKEASSGFMEIMVHGSLTLWRMRWGTLSATGTAATQTA